VLIRRDVVPTKHLVAVTLGWEEIELVTGR
jgi:hypothetical protein